MLLLCWVRSGVVRGAGGGRCGYYGSALCLAVTDKLVCLGGVGGHVALAAVGICLDFV